MSKTMARGVAVTCQTFPLETFGVSIYPWFRSKVIRIVRHGEGFHNVAGEIDVANYKSWEFMDSSLTDLGWQQVKALHDHVKDSGLKSQVELVVVSPLLRTLQTAAGVWGGAVLQEGKSEDFPFVVSGMEKAQDLPIAPSRQVKIVANEWCRAMTGVNPCDRRSNVSLYRKCFLGVDFSEVQTDEDTWWNDTKPETEEDVSERARVLVRWLLDRPESQIAVVSHNSFIYPLLRLFGADCSNIVRREIQTGLRNCEMRSMVIMDQVASSPPTAASLDFCRDLYDDSLLKDTNVRFRETGS